MVYECKQQTIIYNGEQYPLRYIQCDDEMIEALEGLDNNTYYNTFEEALHVLKNICPIVEVATGTYAGADRQAMFGNTNTMFNEGKFYYVGDFYGTQGNILNMSGKVYNSNNTLYVNYTNEYINNLYDANTNEHIVTYNLGLFSYLEIFGKMGGSVIFVSDNYLLNLSITYLDITSGTGYVIDTSFKTDLETTVFYKFFEGITPTDYTDYDDPQDPYLYDSADDDGGQGTNQNWTPDNISERDLPDNFYSNSGLMKVLTPTESELRAFSNYLWGNTFDISSFKKIVNNPFDLILGFQYLPFKTVDGGTIPINVGNIASVDTGLHMTYPTKENYKHSFGSLNLSKMEHKFLDYSPYCKMSIHLPFIGTQQIDPDLIRKASPVELIYKYNIVTGTIVAFLKGKIEGQNGVLYEWVGNCNNTLPVASNDYSNSISGMFSMITGAVSGAVAGGSVGGGVGASVGAVTGVIGSLNVADMKPTITTQGSIGGNGAVLNSSNDAFIITEQQRLSVATNPKGHKHLMGYPKNKGGQIKDSLGYNNIKACRMACDYAMSEELQEITDILTTGYIYGDVGGHPNAKPSRPSGNNVVVALYQNSSSNIRIDKDLKHLHTYDCILKENTSIINPTIRLKASDVNVLKGNYCYIPKFNRFYYINNVTSINADTWELSLHVDVLMSFRDDIETRHVVFNHSESGYNLYLNDGSLQMDSRPKITWNKFPNSLTNDGRYVLLLAGA